MSGRLKYILPVITFVALLVGNVVVGQEFKSYPISFLKTQEEESTASTADEQSLAQQLEEMKIRLEELEYDVEKKLEAARKSEAGADGKVGESLEARLKGIESSVESQSEAITNLNSELPGHVLSGHCSPRMYLFGRMQLDWWAFPRAQPGINNLEFGQDPEDRVDFRRLRLGVAGDLNTNMFYRVELDVADRPANNIYRDVFIGFRDTPLLNTVIIGHHKRPYGLDHLNDSNFNIFMERPFIVEALNRGSRRLGISSNGVNKNKSINWRYGVWGQAESTTNFFGTGNANDDYQPEAAGRIAFMPWFDARSGGRGYFHFAASGSLGLLDGNGFIGNSASRFSTRPEAQSQNAWIDTLPIIGAVSNNRLGLEAVFNVGAFQLSGEYMTMGLNRDNAFGPNLRFDGGYVQAAYMLTGEHIPWIREWGVMGRVKPFENFFSVRDCDGNVKRGLGAWQVAARYSWADLTDQDVVGGQGDSLTLATNWYWNQNARMQFNYILGEINRPPFTDAGGEYSAVGVRFQVDF